MPRRYTLGRREGPSGIPAPGPWMPPSPISGDRGMAAASNLAVAKAADVAPATVRNHFPGPRDLSDAVFQQVLGRLAPPTPAIFEGVAEAARAGICRLDAESRTSTRAATSGGGPISGNPSSSRPGRAASTATTVTSTV